MEYEGKKITREEVKKAVQEVFRETRMIDHERWYSSLSKQQQEAVHKIFKAEVQKQLDGLERRKIKIIGGVGGAILDEEGTYPMKDLKPWWEDPESETFKKWTKEREKMNKKNKKYKQ